MTYTENYFQKLPTNEKSSRWRKYNLYLASANPTEAVNRISKEFFTKETAKSLTDPIKCVPVIQKIMLSTPHMEDLSDFVAICFVFTYKYYQSQSQSIGLLKLCLQKNFKFENDELDLMNKAMIEDPPQKESDTKFCSQFIALTCKKSDYCADFLVKRYQEVKYSEKQANFLKEISKEISRDPKNFNESQLQIINADLPIDQLSFKKNKNKNSLSEKNFRKAERSKKVDSIYSKFRNYQSIIFIILTIFILLLIILIV